MDRAAVKLLSAGMVNAWAEKKQKRGFNAGVKRKKTQIRVNHTQEGIGHGRQPAGQVKGEQ
jgi:hypothetical protein